MKKIYTLIVAAFVCANSANAQFTMMQDYQEPSFATDQSRADMNLYDSTTALPKSTGQAQIWDFSNMVLSTVVVTSTYVAAGSAPNSTTFPTANIAHMDGKGNYGYYRSDSVQERFEMVGATAGTEVTTYSDSKILYEWPIQYNDNFSDAYAATDGVESTTGTYSLSSTGMGALTLVGPKSFNNVMQLSATDHATITSTADTSELHIKSYQYFHSLNRYPLLTIHYTHSMSGATEIRTSRILVNWLEAVGLTDNNFNADYAIYPNPASNHFAVKLSNASAQPCTITLQTITGGVIRTIDMGTSQAIETNVDVSDLPQGIYMVRTTLGDKTGIKKLIIE